MFTYQPDVGRASKGDVGNGFHADQAPHQGAKEALTADGVLFIDRTQALQQKSDQQRSLVRMEGGEGGKELLEKKLRMLGEI